MWTPQVARARFQRSGKDTVLVLTDMRNYPPLDVLGAQLIAAQVAQYPNLAYVAFHTVGDAELEILMAALQALEPAPAIRGLTFQNGGFGARGARAVASVLPRWTRLERLWLSSPADGHVLATILDSVRALLLSRIDLSAGTGSAASGGEPVVSEEGVRALLAVLRASARLKELSIYGLPFGDDASARIVDAAVASGAPLAKLTMMNVCLGNGAVAAIAGALGHWPCLKDLRLHNNSAITDHGAQVLAEALPGAVSLGSLTLDDTGISEAGSRVLLAVIPRCLALTELLSLPDPDPHRRFAEGSVGHDAILAMDANRRRAAAAKKAAATAAAKRTREATATAKASASAAHKASH